jgi:hypothetical protein
LKVIGFLILLVTLFIISEGAGEPLDVIWLAIGILLLFPTIASTAWRKFTDDNQQQ